MTAKEICERAWADSFVVTTPTPIHLDAVYDDETLVRVLRLRDPEDIDAVLNYLPSLKLPSGKRLFLGTHVIVTIDSLKDLTIANA